MMPEPTRLLAIVMDDSPALWGWGGMLLLAVLIAVPVMVSLYRRSTQPNPLLTLGGTASAVAIGPHTVPSRVRGFMDLHHPHLDRMNFVFVADCQMLQGPRPIYCRYYAGHDGCVYAELSVAQLGGSLDQPMETQALTFVTVFSNGTLMQTCDLGEGRREDLPPDEDGVMYRFRPNLSIDDLHRDHLHAVWAYEAEHRVSALRYPPEQIVEISLQYAECQRRHNAQYDPLRWPVVYQPEPAYACSLPQGRPLLSVRN